MSRHRIGDNGDPQFATGDWRQRMTITIPEYAQIVGVGRNTAYEAAHSEVRSRAMSSWPFFARREFETPRLGLCHVEVAH